MDSAPIDDVPRPADPLPAAPDPLPAAPGARWPAPRPGIDGPPDLREPIGPRGAARMALRPRRGTVLQCGHGPPCPLEVWMDSAPIDDVPRPADPLPAAPDPLPAAPGAIRLPIGEDWLATLVGLALVVFVLLGIVTKALIP